MPALITKKNKRTYIEYDSDGLIISYHRKYYVARKNKATDPFALPQPCNNPQKKLNIKTIKRR